MSRTIVFVSNDPPPEGLDLDGYPDLRIFWYRALDEEQATVQEILDLCRAKRAVAVLSGGPKTVALATQVSELLGLSWQAGCRAQWLTDRALLLDGLTGAGIETIEYRLAVRARDAQAAARALGEPVVVQSVVGCEGFQSRYVLHEPETRLAFNQVTQRGGTKRVLVTRPESAARFSVFCYVHKSETTIAGVVDVEADSRFMFPRYLATPTKLTEAILAEVESIAAAVVDRVRLRHGVLRVDLVQRSDSFGVSAVDTSPISNWLPVDLIRLAGAGDLYGSVVHLATGEPPADPTDAERVAGIVWLDAPSGEVTSIDGIDAVRSMDGVEAVHLRVQPGHVMRHTVEQSGRDKVGYAVVTGADHAACRALADQVRETVVVHTQTLYATTGS